jgi:hypothetical protein
MTGKSEDAEFAKYRLALNNILQAIKPLKARDAGAALSFMLAQIIVFATDDGDDKPDMKERVSRLAATNRALGTMVEHLIRAHMDDNSPLHPDLLRSFLEQRRRGRL